MCLICCGFVQLFYFALFFRCEFNLIYAFFWGLFAYHDVFTSEFNQPEQCIESLIRCILIRNKVGVYAELVHPLLD